MKKLFAIVLAVAMIAAMAIAVSADTVTDKTGNFTSIAITGTVTEVAYADTYKVTLAYQNVAFAYGEGTRTWNPDNLTWGAAAGAKWTADTATITITNRSSQAVTAKLEATAIANGVQIAFTGLDDAGKVAIDSASKGHDVAGEEKSATVTVKASGAPAVGTTAIATITVALV